MLQNNNVLLKSVIMGDFFENECKRSYLQKMVTVFFANCNVQLTYFAVCTC